MRYTGSCHCGQVRFEVEGELERGWTATVRSARARVCCCGLRRAIRRQDKDSLR
jgi:hypothetical protein